ncbi:MAG TPA: hypothetical protein VJR27_05945 [Candidatus Saccharimonadales bacterium]|nr:hypothetical protein [Candidatus Saccharimonadales bacterium]
MRGGLGLILGRIAGAIGGLLFIGIILRLLVAILQPVLPGGLMQAVSSGWDMLFRIVSPALPAIFAVIILGAVVWVIIGRRR